MFILLEILVISLEIELFYSFIISVCKTMGFHPNISIHTFCSHLLPSTSCPIPTAPFLLQIAPVLSCCIFIYIYMHIYVHTSFTESPGLCICFLCFPLAFSEFGVSFSHCLFSSCLPFSHNLYSRLGIWKKTCHRSLSF